MRLPLDCEASYLPGFLTVAESAEIFEAIETSCQFSDVVEMADGSQHVLDVGKLMFSDADNLATGALHSSFGAREPWIEPVKDLRARIEAHVGRTYDVCVCIRYDSGQSGVAFHSDLEAYGDVSSIASVSLGQQRAFVFRRRVDHDDTFDIELEDGSLLLMGEHCQDRYEHALPVDATRVGPRINLTFRTLGWTSRDAGSGV